MEEDWFLYSITLFTFIVIFSFCYIRHIYTSFERNRISIAKYPTFPFGNITDVIFKRVPLFMQLHKFYKSYKRKNCLFGGFYVFLKPSVVVVHPQLTLEVLKSNQFCDIKSNFAEFDSVVKNKLLDQFCIKITKIWTQVLKCEKQKEINFTELVDTFTLEFSQQKVQQLHKSAFKSLLEIAYPKCVIFFQKSQKNKIYTDDDFLQILIENGISIDFIPVLIDYLIKANNLLLFVLYELCNDNEIQENLREEIIRFKKNQTSVTYNEIEKIEYLETVVCETLRKYPLDPFVCKTVKENYSEFGVNWSKDTILFVSIFSIHHDPDNYINPQKFDPDRFSQEDIKFLDANKYLPFGDKIIDSFDSNFVKLVLKVALIELLSRYSLSLGKKSPKIIHFDESPFQMLKWKEEMWLQIE